RQLVAPGCELQIRAGSKGNQGAGHIDLGRTHRWFIAERRSWNALVFAYDSGRKAKAAAEFGGIAVHETTPKQSQNGRVRGRAHLLLSYEAEVFRDSAVPTQGANHGVRGGLILSCPQTLGLVDAAAIRVERTASLQRNVAGRAVDVAQPDHRGERVR